MHINLLWTGREYYSLENCHVEIQPQGVEIESTIVGKYGDVIYKVSYNIRTNPQWETQLLKIHSRHNDIVQNILLESDGNGNWIFNGRKTGTFRGMHGCRHSTDAVHEHITCSPTETESK